MAQMVEHAEKQHDIESLFQSGEIVDGELQEFDLDADDLCGKAGLPEIGPIDIDTEHARRTAPLHLDRVEAAVAADIEHGSAAQIGRQRMPKAAPFHRRVVAEKMLRSGRNSAEINIMEPRPEGLRLAADLVERKSAHCRRPSLAALPAPKTACARVPLPVSKRIASR